MKKKEVIFTAAITLFTFVSTLTLIEVTLRVRHHKFTLSNFVEENWNLVSWEFPIQHDTKLGWTPKHNFSSNVKEPKRLTINERGIRSNGPSLLNPAKLSGTILAVGASTVFGSQVADHETWPAQLEKEIKRPVINGGVFAYGVDQAILRLEQLIPEFHPSRVILGIHPDNLNQVTMSQKYGKKPYFEIVNDQLELRNTPVPPTQKEMSPHQAILGYSYLAHYLFSKLSPQFWLESHGEIKVHNKEKEVSCLLVQKYDDICKKNHLKCSVLFQYFHTTVPEAREKILDLTSCLKKLSVSTWDTYPVLEALKSSDRNLYDSFFDFHMTSRGNTWTANYIKENIELEDEDGFKTTKVN